MSRLAIWTCALGASCALSSAVRAQEPNGGPVLAPPEVQENTSIDQTDSQVRSNDAQAPTEPTDSPRPESQERTLSEPSAPSEVGQFTTVPQRGDGADVPYRILNGQPTNPPAPWNLSTFGPGGDRPLIDGSSGYPVPVPGIPQAPRGGLISDSGPPVVVGGPVSSSEAERIASWYRLYIGREITDGELQQILSDRAQGVPLEAVLASILGSREWYHRAGHSPRSWILETLSTLGGPSPLDLRSWLLGLRDSGGDRVAMARVMIERFGMPDPRQRTARVPDVYLQRPVAPGYARSAPPAPLYPPPPIHQHGPYHDDDFYDDDFRYGGLRRGGLNPLSSLLFEAVLGGDRHDHDRHRHRHLRSHRGHVDRDHDHHAHRHHVQQERIQRHRIQERVQNRIQRQRSAQRRIQQQRAQQRRIQQQRARRHRAHQHREAGHQHPPHRARGGHPHAHRHHGDDDDREDAIRKRRRQRQKQQRQRQRQRHRHHDHDD